MYTRPSPERASAVALLALARCPARVRPFTVTGGRTGAQRPLGAERLVSAATYDPRAAQALSPEEYAICNACTSCRSIAEIAVATGQPIGVVRVLVGDLAKAGRVVVHPAAADLSKAALLERVLNGLQHL